MHTGVQQQKTIKQTNEAVIRLDLEKKQAVRKADREHRTMLQYKTLLAESKTPLLLAQKEIASLQKELDGFRKAVDAKAKERDAMEREAKFAKAETEKVFARRPVAFLRRLHAIDARRLRESRSWVVSLSILRPFGPRRGLGTAERPEPAQNRPRDHPRHRAMATRHVNPTAGREADRRDRDAREGTGTYCVFVGGRDGDLQK